MIWGAVGQHGDVVAAIESGDIALAECLMLTHLRRILVSVDLARERYPDCLEPAPARIGAGRT